MKLAFSAGGIIFNNSGEVLLIRSTSLHDPAKSYWGFPKGTLEPGESSKEAALREVEEETGIKVEIVSKIGDSKYVFTQKGEKFFKVVNFFLMKAQSGQITPQPNEISEAGWFDPEEASKKLSFSKDKDLLKKSLELIKGDGNG